MARHISDRKEVLFVAQTFAQTILSVGAGAGTSQVMVLFLRRFIMVYSKVRPLVWLKTLNDNRKLRSDYRTPVYLSDTIYLLRLLASCFCFLQGGSSQSQRDCEPTSFSDPSNNVRMIGKVCKSGRRKRQAAPVGLLYWITRLRTLSVRMDFNAASGFIVSVESSRNWKWVYLLFTESISLMG